VHIDDDGVMHEGVAAGAVAEKVVPYIPAEASTGAAAAPRPASGAGTSTTTKVVPAADAAGARLRVAELVRAGRCSEAEEPARSQARGGGVDGILAWMRFRTVCSSNAAEAEQAGEALARMHGLSSTDRARVYGTLALVGLWEGRLTPALQACARMAELDATSPFAVRMMARCHLAEGKLDAVPAEIPLRSGFDVDTTLAVLAGGKPAGAALSKPWHKGTALAHAVTSLEKLPPKRVLDDARAALLAPRWDGSEDFPWSRIELGAIARRAPAVHQEFAQALAAALASEHAATSDEALRPLLRGAVSWSAGRREELPSSSELAHAPDGVLRRFLLAASRDEPKARALARKPLLVDPQLGPFAALDASREGTPSDPRLIDAWRRRWPDHPALAALAPPR
jgi:hypothetical protein